MKVDGIIVCEHGEKETKVTCCSTKNKIPIYADCCLSLFRRLDTHTQVLLTMLMIDESMNNQKELKEILED